jgi:hypothetical protein
MRRSNVLSFPLQLAFPVRSSLFVAGIKVVQKALLDLHLK